MSNEHGALVAPDGPPDPLMLIARALDKGMDVSQLKELFDLQERHERNQAAKEYSTAVAEFQARCPRISKRRTARVDSRREGGRGYEYQFASYDDVMSQAGPVLAEVGLAVTFTNPKRYEKGIQLRCRIRKGVHYEDHELEIPVPQLASNDTQAYGAALSYAKRYLLCAALNIVVTDEDDDAAALLERASPEHVQEMQRLIAEKGVNLRRFLDWAGKGGQIDRIEEVAARDVPAALDYLRRTPRPKPEAK